MIVKFWLLKTNGNQLLARYWSASSGILCRLCRNFELVAYKISRSPLV